MKDYVSFMSLEKKKATSNVWLTGSTLLNGAPQVSSIVTDTDVEMKMTEGVRKMEAVMEVCSSEWEFWCEQIFAVNANNSAAFLISFDWGISTALLVS